MTSLRLELYLPKGGGPFSMFTGSTDRKLIGKEENLLPGPMLRALTVCGRRSSLLSFSAQLTKAAIADTLWFLTPVNQGLKH